MENIFEKYDLVNIDCDIEIPIIPNYGLILIYGSSGSGKSTILRKTFGEKKIVFSNNPVYLDFSSPENAEKLFIACGFRTIPAWRRPYHSLSTGEQHRAYCAKSLDLGLEYIDEFSSVVDRDTAKALSVSIKKYFDTSKMNRLIIATCHSDIIEWLQPNHVYNTNNKIWLPRECLQQGRPRITIRLEPCDGKKVWPMFKKYHYISHDYNSSANAWVALYNDKPVAFESILAFPSKNLHNAWREHRLVVIPEFQGLGIGNSISEEIGELLLSLGYRFYSKTAHPSMGMHRNNSPKWRATAHNGKDRLDYDPTRVCKEKNLALFNKTRKCYTHEYIG